MNDTQRRSWLSLIALAALICSNGLFSAAEPAKTEAAPSDGIVLPKASDVQSLAVNVSKVALKGGDDAQQLVVTAVLKDGRLQDITGGCTYQPADPRVVRVSTAGRVIPLSNGTTEVAITFGAKSAKVQAGAESLDKALRINFTNQIVPIFTKLGCNSGGCHGKASGQNGFKLSLLGFEPEVDFTALVKEGRGRRLFPASPENSLLLLKAAGRLHHGGGKRMEVGSDEYRLVRRWIATGMPFGLPTDPVVTKITIFPEQRVLSRDNQQQVAVLAHYSDGRTEDVSRRALYDTNDSEVALVDGSGVVRSLKMSGEAAIMARYQGHVTAFRASVPLGVPIPQYKFEHKTVVDQHTHKKWQGLGLVPSELCTDEQFIRRVSLDIAGTLPTPAQVVAFVDSRDPNKRDKLVDTLLETPEYSYFFASKWADILRVHSDTFGFHNWIREAIAADMPYDEFTRNIIGASGGADKNPPSYWFKELFGPREDAAKFQAEFVDNVGQVFLGLRLSCAQCHHHPYEKWSQDDYWGIATFVGPVALKAEVKPGDTAQSNRFQRVFVYARSGAEPRIMIPRTTRQAVMKVLDGEAAKPNPDADPRQLLVDWMVDAKNPFFARAVANRYWAHFFGRGIVDPLDDMRVTNPPSNPELLDALTKNLLDNKYSLKSLIRTICKSRTYQLSAVPNDFNKQDKQTYARYYPKRMGAEVLFDAVCQVTNSPTVFPGFQDRHAPRRAIMLPDDSFRSYFLDVFGRPKRISACECERVSEANLAQVLHLLNSDEVQNKLAAANGRADILARDPRPDAQKVEELFLWAFGRKPAQADIDTALEHIKNEKTKKIAYEDLLWALINSKEFNFNK
jgi:hypothetical protein